MMQLVQPIIPRTSNLFGLSVCPEPELARDVLQLVRCLRMVSGAISGSAAYEMEQVLEHLEPPGQAAEVVLENLLSDRSVFASSHKSMSFSGDVTRDLTN